MLKEYIAQTVQLFVHEYECPFTKKVKMFPKSGREITRTMGFDQLRTRILLIINGVYGFVAGLFSPVSWLLMPYAGWLARREVLSRRRFIVASIGFTIGALIASVFFGATLLGFKQSLLFGAITGMSYFVGGVAAEVNHLWQVRKGATRCHG